MQNYEADKKSWSENVKLFATVIGIASPLLALATFVGLKPEKKKDLQWEYLSKTSLVNPSAAATEKISVLYENRPIKQLTIISARLVNVGATPIESSDVKDGAFPTVTFPNSVTIIGAEIKTRVPKDIKATLFFGTNYVRVEHGLLNPTDSLAIQILFDGDLGDLTGFPAVSYRIAGINIPTTKYAQPEKKIMPVTYFPMGSFAVYLILILASFPALLMLLLWATAMRELYRAAFPKATVNRIIAEAVGRNLSLQTSTAETVTAFAKDLYIKLPKPLDARARDLVLKTGSAPGEEKKAYFGRIEPLVKDELLRFNFRTRLRYLDKAILVAVVVAAATAAANILLLATSWIRAIGGS